MKSLHGRRVPGRRESQSWLRWWLRSRISLPPLTWTPVSDLLDQTEASNLEGSVMHHKPRHSNHHTAIDHTAVSAEGNGKPPARWLLPVLLVAQLMVILDI